MKVLLFGANGQVGHALRSSLAPLGEVVATTRNGRFDDGTVCEVADFDQPAQLVALIDRVAPDIVVNAAAYTAVDRAESEADIAFRVNAQAPAAIAAACAARGAFLMHYSTDYVFDGSATRPYREDDPTHPLGIYGASKLAGEDAIRSSGARHMILRTAWIYAAHGSNFLRTMLRLAAERDELRVVDDQVGTPTSAAFLASTTAAILEQPTPVSGIWHVTNAGATSWHGFAQCIVEQAHASGLLPRSPPVIAIGTKDYPTRARRPAYSCLDTSRLVMDFNIEPPDWRSSLAQALAELPQPAKMT